MKHPTSKSGVSVAAPHTKNAASHYVVAISELRSQYGYARVTDLARYLDRTRGSVSITLKSLERKELVTRDPNGFLLLTAAGTLLAETTGAKNRRLLHLFGKLLGVPDTTAEQDSRRIGHLISRESAHQICTLMRFIDSGHPVTRQFLREFQRFSKALSGTDGCESCSDGCRFDSDTVEPFEDSTGHD